MMRILLFLGTNLAILVVLTVAIKLLGLEAMLAQHGAGGLDLTSLLIIAAIIGMVGSFISLAMSKWTAKNITGAQVIDRPTNAIEGWLVDTVSRLARQAGIGMPEVAIYDSPDMNAFATGMNRDHALVAVSTGLLRNMRKDEIEAVLGHEVSHIANGDMITLALIQGVLNTFVFFLARVVGLVVDNLLLRRGEQEESPNFGIGYWMTTLVAEIILGILATLIVMWFSRYREFRADAGGARLAGKEKMIAALERLQMSLDQPHLPDQLAAFGISGKIGSGLARLFMSHPPLEERIAALRGGRG